MARQWDTAEVRAAIERLRFSDEIGPTEIRDRLHAGEAGLPCKVPISLRQVHHYLRDIRERRIREAAENPGATVSEVAELEARMVARLRQEIAYIESKRLGRLTSEDTRKLNAAHRALIDIDKRARKFAKRAASSGKRAASEPGKPETPLERMAREERESVAAEQSPSNPLDTHRRDGQADTTDAERASVGARTGDGSGQARGPSLP